MKVIISEKGKTFKGEKIHDGNIGNHHVIWRGKIYRTGNNRNYAIELYDGVYFHRLVHSSSLYLIKVQRDK